MIKSFPKNATVFTSNGQRVIQPLFCKEHREIGDWFIELNAPLEFQSYLEHDMIIVVATKEKGNQPFRIKNPKVTSKVEVKAFHIGFDSANHAVELSTVTNANCTTALTTLLTNTEDTTNFTVYSDITTLKTFSVVNLSLYDALRQIADEYNGVLDFDGWQIRITANIGADNGVVLAYGKNIQESEITENWDLVVTKLKPIGNDGILLTPEWLTADVSYDRPYTKIMTFDSDNVSNLALVAQLYLDRYKVPRVNYKVKADVEQNVALGDAVVVKARQFTTSAEVLSYDYNPISQRVIAVEFGNFRPTLKNFFSEMTQAVEEKAVKKAQLKIDDMAGEIEAYADNKIELAVGTAIGGQDSILPYTQDTWEVGGLDVSTGGTVSNSEYLRTKTTGLVSPSIDIVLTCSSLIDPTTTAILFYTSANAFISAFSFTGRERKITTPSNAYYFKVRARKSAGGTFNLSEMPSHWVRVTPIQKYLKGARYEFTDTNFAIKNNLGDTVLTADIAGNLEMIGKVTATSGKIGRFDISGDDLVYTSDLFNKEYDYSDISKLRRILAGLDTPTDYENEVYDTNNSGTLTITDLSQIVAYVESGTPLPTPRRQIRSVIRIGTTSGEIKTTAVSAGGHTGQTFVMKADKLTGELIDVKILSAKDVVLNGESIMTNGTWSPTVIGTTTAGTGTYLAQVGKYTKIGRKVNFDIQLTWTAHTGTGNMEVTLPFNNGDSWSPVVVIPSSLTYANQLGAMCVPNVARIRFYTFASNIAFTAGLTLDTSASVFISGSYMV
jgi:phage minor structural protein